MVRTRFQSRFGTPIRPRNLTRTFKSLLSKAGLPQTIRIHDLRHTSASLALTAGVGLKTVSERLGHSSISITADIYTHVSLDLQKDATDKIRNQLFSSSGSGNNSGHEG